MPRYPKQPLEDKLAWMREQQRAKAEESRRQEEKQAGEKAAQLAAPSTVALLERPSRKMLRVDEVAQILRVSVSTVQRWFRDRAVIVHPGPRKTHMLISEQILDDWIAENTAKRRGRR